MRLDRHINQDGRGKYALVLLRNTNLPLKKIKTLCHEAGIPLDLGIAGTGSEFFVIRLNALELFIIQFFKIQQSVMRTLYSTNQLVQFYLYRTGIPVLRVLDEKYHEKSYYCGPGIYHELPRIAESEDRTGNRPDNDDRYGDYKRSRVSRCIRRPFCEAVKP